MKKTYLPYWILLLCSFTSFAQKDYTITITVNLEDCLNCNATVFDLRNYKEDFNIQVLMQEVFESDTAFIYEKYNFKDVVEAITFSDSLFDSYAPMGSAMISVESKHNTGRYTMHIKETYERGFFTYLDGLKENTSVLFKDYPTLTRGASEMQINEKGYLAVNVPYRGTVYVYDMLNQKLVDTIQIPEELFKENFGMNDYDIPESTYEDMRRTFKEKKIAEFEKIRNIFYIEDTLCFIIESSLLLNSIDEFGQKDSGIYGTCGIVKYVNGEFVGYNKFDLYLKDEKNKTIYHSSMNLHYYNKKLYGSLFAFPLIDVWDHFGILKMQNNIYTYALLDFSSSAPIYKNTIDFSIPVFFKNAYVLPVVNEVRSVETGELLETLPFFINATSLSRSTTPEMYFVENGLAMNEDFIWVHLYNSVIKKEEFYKMDRKTKSFTLSEFGLAHKSNNIVHFDPINPDYIIYKDDKKNTLIREKIF